MITVLHAASEPFNWPEAVVAIAFIAGMAFMVYAFVRWG